MFIGVTKGFKYKMRYVYAHFPITGVINKDGHQLEIRNFLGEKRRRVVNLAGDTTVVKSADVKDQIEVSGINIEDVGKSCTCVFVCVSARALARLCCVSTQFMLHIFCRLSY